MASFVNLQRLMSLGLGALVIASCATGTALDELGELEFGASGTGGALGGSGGNSNGGTAAVVFAGTGGGVSGSGGGVSGSGGGVSGTGGTSGSGGGDSGTGGGVSGTGGTSGTGGASGTGGTSGTGGGASGTGGGGGTGGTVGGCDWSMESTCASEACTMCNPSPSDTYCGNACNAVIACVKMNPGCSTADDPLCIKRLNGGATNNVCTGPGDGASGAPSVQALALYQCVCGGG